MSKKDDTNIEKASTAEIANTTADPNYIEKQRKLVAGAVGGDIDAKVIRPDELAVKLKYDITGGLGRHSGGTVIRNLSESAFTTLRDGGGHDVVEPGTSVGDDAVDAAAPLA